MTATELIANKIQEILGAKYLVKPYALFARDYIQPYNTPYGKTYDINYQAFEEMQNTIPVSVLFQESTPINSDLYYRTGIFTVQFFVPVDAVSKKGAVAFFDDYEHLRIELTNGRIVLSAELVNKGAEERPEYVSEWYKSYFTLGEPTTDGAIQSTGAYRRMVFTATGNATIVDKRFGTGDDYEITMFDDGGYTRSFKNITNLVISRDEQGNAVQNEGTTATRQPPVSRVHTISFTVNDTDDDAVKVVRNAVFKMGEFPVDYEDTGLNQAPNEQESREYLISLVYKGIAGDANDDQQLSTFFATMSATYTAPSTTSVGAFNVVFTRTDYAEQGEGMNG